MKRVLAVVIISVALAALSPMQNAAEARQSAAGEDRSAADTRDHRGQMDVPITRHYLRGANAGKSFAAVGEDQCSLPPGRTGGQLMCFPQQSTQSPARLAAGFCEAAGRWFPGDDYDANNNSQGKWATTKRPSGTRRCSPTSA
jgi:hypothetical protein